MAAVAGGPGAERPVPLRDARKHYELGANHARCQADDWRSHYRCARGSGGRSVTLPAHLAPGPPAPAVGAAVLPCRAGRTTTTPLPTCSPWTRPAVPPVCYISFLTQDPRKRSDRRPARACTWDGSKIDGVRRSCRPTMPFRGHPRRYFPATPTTRRRHNIMRRGMLRWQQNWQRAAAVSALPSLCTRSMRVVFLPR